MERAFKSHTVKTIVTNLNCGRWEVNRNEKWEIISNNASHKNNETTKAANIGKWVQSANHLHLQSTVCKPSWWWPWHFYYSVYIFFFFSFSFLITFVLVHCSSIECFDDGCLASVVLCRQNYVLHDIYEKKFHRISSKAVRSHHKQSSHIWVWAEWKAINFFVLVGFCFGRLSLDVYSRLFFESQPKMKNENKIRTLLRKPTKKLYWERKKKAIKVFNKRMMKTKIKMYSNIFILNHTSCIITVEQIKQKDETPKRKQLFLFSHF